MTSLDGGDGGQERGIRCQRDGRTDAWTALDRDCDAAICEYVVRVAMQSLELLDCAEGDLPALLAAARTRLRRDRTATVTEPVTAFRRLRAVWLEGDRGAMVELFSSDVEIVTVGGPDSRRLRLPVRGSRDVAALLTDIMSDEPPVPELMLVDRVPWLIGRIDRLVVGLLAAEVFCESVRQVWLVDGPDKLGR